MPRRIKDFIDISEYTSLDDLIRYLETIRDNLPPEHDAELKIRGDEVFGRRLTITYFRNQTPEETELESRYGGRAWVNKMGPDDPPMRALARAIRIAHALYRPHHVCLAGGIGNRMGRLLPDLRHAVEDRLTNIARAGWTLSVGSGPPVRNQNMRCGGSGVGHGNLRRKPR